MDVSTPSPFRIDSILEWEEVCEGSLEHLSEGMFHNLVNVTYYTEESHFLTNPQ